MEVGSEIVAGATISVLKNIDIGAIRVVADRIAIGGRDNFGLAPTFTRSVSLMGFAVKSWCNLLLSHPERK
jgi:hypothetical protein